MRPPEPARNARFRFNCRIPLVRASSGRWRVFCCGVVYTTATKHTPRQSQSFFRGYGSSLPTSLTHVPPLGQRLRTLRTCCGYRYDRGAAPRHAPSPAHRRAGPLAFHGPSGALRRVHSVRRRTHTPAAHKLRNSGGLSSLVHAAARHPSPAKPLPEPARLLPPARTLASERADNSSRGPRRRRQRPCRGVAALYVPVAHARGSGMLARRPVDRRCAPKEEKHTTPPKSGRPISQARLTRGRPQWPRNPSSRRPSRFLA
jgi:hypothetical protein